MLRIVYKDGRSGPVLLSEPGKTIGKGQANDIVLDEEGVNGFHADLKVEGQIVTLSDINTAAGTFLNGEKISATMSVRVGDIITIQGVELELVDASEGATGGKTLVLSGTALLEMGVGGWSIMADSGPEKGQVIPVKETIMIGRALECDLSILEPGLSRKHAELMLDQGDLWIRDLQSSNGTYVNGKKVELQELKDGDNLQFEKVRFVVQGP